MADERDKAILADWAKHPGHAIMRSNFLQARTDFYVSLAKRLYRQPALVTESDLLCQKAFFRGALWVLNEPVFTRQALERAQSNEGETDDE